MKSKLYSCAINKANPLTDKLRVFKMPYNGKMVISVALFLEVN